MTTEAIEHCVNKVCGKSFPRKVNFCPYCGTRQLAGAAAPPSPAAQSAAQAGSARAQPPAPPPGPSAAPDPAPAPPSRPDIGAKPPPAATPLPGARAEPPRQQQPLRKPVSKSTWALVVLGLAAIWIIARPGDPGKKLEARIDQAVALTAECKIDIARAELTSLKTDKAKPAQLKRLQDAIGSAAPACEKKRLRARAWTDLQPLLDSAVQTGAFDRAASRLAAFTRKWGEDADTRDWDSRIDARRGERLLDEADACLKKQDRACLENKLIAAERLQRPELGPRIQLLRDELSRLLEATVLEQASPAPPAPSASRPTPPVISTVPPAVTAAPPQAMQSAQQARKILADAERELAGENYKSAMDKADICATMIDVGNRDCLALKQRAERLHRDMLRCVASGAEWIKGRCQ